MFFRFNEELTNAIEKCANSVAKRLEVSKSTFYLGIDNKRILIEFETSEDNTYATLEFHHKAFNNVDLKIVLDTYDHIAEFKKESRTLQLQVVNRKDQTWCS